MEKNKFFSYDNIPMEIKVIYLEDNYSNWHKELKIIYVLQGEILLESSDGKTVLSENEFSLVNSYELLNIQSINKQKSTFLEILIDDSYYNRYYQDFSYIRFKCISTEKAISTNKYDKIRSYFSKIFYILSENKEVKSILFLDVINDLTLYLVNNFKVEMDFSADKDISNKNRLIKILGYLEKNYGDYNLKVQDIADNVGLNSQYMLRLFKKNMNIGLVEFLNSLRLKKSLNELLYTNKSIVEIAIENGFNDNKSYNRIFKKEFNMTPGFYRKNSLNTKNEDNEISKFIREKDIFKHFEKYLEFNDVEKSLDENSKEMKFFEISLKSHKKKKIEPYWKKILGLGNAAMGLKGDVQYQLKKTKDEIDFQYVKFNNIFNEEMFIYNEDEDGTPYYNYVYIDKLIDYLIQLKLKPFINIGFMPKKLASKNETIFAQKVNVSFPRDMSKWKGLVEGLVKHFLERYGENEVVSWYFEIWNNPDFKGVFWNETQEKYHYFFEETFYSIKSIHNKIKVGGPSAFSCFDWNWTERFLNFIKISNIEIDFFSYHSYGMKGGTKEIESINRMKSGNLEFTEYNFLKNTVKFINSKIQEVYPKKLEIIVSEWNSSPSFQDLVHDTCYMSSFIINGALNNFNSLSGLAYWTFTDIFEENGMGTELFHGGMGLFTINNLKKSSYNAFVLLNKLGNEFICKSNNYFITQKENSYQILLYNYVHYNKEYEKGNLSGVNKFNRYEAFLNNNDLEFTLKISDLEKGKYFITKYYLDRESGSVYDAWIEMGAPEKITSEFFQFLKSKERMNIKTEKKEIESEFLVNEIVKCHGIVFINLEKIY